MTATTNKPTTRDRFKELIENMTPEEQQHELDILMAHIIELQGQRAGEEKVNKMAPEYIDMIAETIDATLTEALVKIEAPQEIKDMAEALYRLASYFASNIINPECDAEEIAEQWTVIGINAAIKAGGVLPTFTGPTTRRSGTLLAGNAYPDIQ